MKIYATLIKVIAEMKNPIKEKENSFFKSKYATLDVICDDMRKIFAKHNIAIIQQPTMNAQGLFVLRATAFSEDETLELGDYLIRPAKDDPQGNGSAITYARRYQLCSLMGIAAEDDDDGNHASGKTAQTATVQPPRPQTAQTQTKTTTTTTQTHTAKDGKSSMNPAVDIDVLKALSVVCAKDLKAEKVTAEVMKSWFMDKHKSDLTKCAQSYIEEIIKKAEC